MDAFASLPIAASVLVWMTACTNTGLDDATRAAAITEVADHIRSEYVYPEIGERLAETLIRNLEDGVYDDISDKDSLASTVLGEILAATNDPHFAFFVRRPAADGDAPDPGPSPSASGLREASVLPGSIGYLALDWMPGDDDALEAVARAFTDLPPVDALILDIRENFGGSGDMIALICGHFFPDSTLLLTFYDRSGGVNGEVRTKRQQRYFPPDIPVYVLTSENTHSAAEAFAYVLKHQGRATIVGDTTPGMSNPSNTRSIAGGFALTVPFLRAHHEHTERDLQGIGIIPDIAVTPESALDVAIAEIMENARAGRQP
jgi:C-terminal processing protease CtpA/Prc